VIRVWHETAKDEEEICKENSVHELNEFEECCLGICSHNFLSELACIIHINKLLCFFSSGDSYLPFLLPPKMLLCVPDFGF